MRSVLADGYKRSGFSTASKEFGSVYFPFWDNATLNTSFLIANELVALRPVEAGDDDFLCRVYASTRTDEMALVDWSDEQKEAFLQMQSDAQRAHYRTHYPKAEYFIIQHNRIDMGRFMVERSKDPIILMDIALLPEYRGLGIGTTLIKDLMTEAADKGWALTLHVEFFNPALALYTRLGFVKIAEQDVYYKMSWRNQESQ
jgi:ribosomal protein S18 acetylase RimI-like enzyme